LRFGLFMMPSHSIRENPTLAFERDLKLIEYIESLGFDECWIGEHHTGGWENIPAPDIFISAAATRTNRIRLGTGAIALPYHHPFHIAERMAFLDHLTLGRLDFGCAPGILGSDIKMFDLDPKDLRPMMNESLDIILKLFNERGEIFYKGNYWDIKGMQIQVKPYQNPHMPIYCVSSGSGNSLKVASERGLNIISGAYTLPGTMKLNEQWDFFEKNSLENGFNVSRKDWTIGNVPIYVSSSRKQALEDIKTGAMHEIRNYTFKAGAKSSFEIYPGQTVDEITIEQIIKQRRWIIGDPDECVAQIKELEKETGGFGGLLLLSIEWTSVEKWYKSLELFSRYVIPQFNNSLNGLTDSYDQMVKDETSGNLPSGRVKKK